MVEGPASVFTPARSLAVDHPTLREAGQWSRKMGNSQRVLISKPILGRAGLEGTADLQMRDGAIETRPVHRDPCEGWAEDAQRLTEQGADSLVWPAVANEGDDELVW
jgi:antitoxin component of MazEF toxin-antitoxin module